MSELNYAFLYRFLEVDKYITRSSKECFHLLLLTHRKREQRMLPVTEDGLLLTCIPLNLWSSTFHTMKDQILNHSDLVFIICTGLNPPHSPERFRFITSQPRYFVLHILEISGLSDQISVLLLALLHITILPFHFIYLRSLSEGIALPLWHLLLDGTQPWQSRADDLFTSYAGMLNHHCPLLYSPSNTCDSESCWDHIHLNVSHLITLITPFCRFLHNIGIHLKSHTRSSYFQICLLGTPCLFPLYATSPVQIIYNATCLVHNPLKYPHLLLYWRHVTGFLL